jgi:hypothetical protein
MKRSSQGHVITDKTSLVDLSAMGFKVQYLESFVQGTRMPAEIHLYSFGLAVWMDMKASKVGPLPRLRWLFSEHFKTCGLSVVPRTMAALKMQR